MKGYKKGIKASRKAVKGYTEQARKEQEMKGYEIIWTDGYFIKVKIINKDGVKQLEDEGYYFDDFYGDGTERWSR